MTIAGWRILPQFPGAMAALAALSLAAACADGPGPGPGAGSSGGPAAFSPLGGGAGGGSSGASAADAGDPPATSGAGASEGAGELGRASAADAPSGVGGVSASTDERSDAGGEGAGAGPGEAAAVDGGTGPGEAPGMDPGGTVETIHYYGRWNRLEDRAITVNTGSHVVAQFSGTGVSARFDVSLNQTPNPTLTWRIDQGPWQEGELAASVALGTNLPAGTHEATLMVRGLNENQSRWNPPLTSSITFLGFEVAAGGELRPSVRPERLTIEFLGDSITEGINLWASRNGQNTPCWRADGARAFASLTAQALGAEWRQVGFGRQGLLIDGNGGVPPANAAFDFFYSGVPRDDWEPDLVVINQGTNDGGAAAGAFRSAYATFLATIRAAYPAAHIASMRPFNGAHATEIRDEVDARRVAGDTRVSYVDTAGWLANGDYTDGLHPNAQGSQKAAQALVTAIEAIGLR